MTYHTIIPIRFSGNYMYTFKFIISNLLSWLVTQVLSLPTRISISDFFIHCQEAEWFNDCQRLINADQTAE